MNDFNENMNDLETAIKKNDRIAAFGYETGTGKDIYDIIKAAEKKMYADKQNYYTETGKERRR